MIDEAALRSAMTSQRPSTTAISTAAREQVLDAAALLQIRRSEIAARVVNGELTAKDGVEVVAVGLPSINGWLFEQTHWTEVLSTRPTATAAQLRAGLPVNRERLRDGVQMVSLFDYWGLDHEARVLLANETSGTYLLAVTPVQMKIIDQRFVLLQGPEVEGEPSLLKVQAAPCMETAWRYWELAVTNTIPFELPTPSTAGMSPRQRQVLALMEADLGDDAIAAALGVSVRTVRSDVAAVLRTLGVTTRFAAAMRLRAWDEASETR